MLVLAPLFLAAVARACVGDVRVQHRDDGPITTIPNEPVPLPTASQPAPVVPSSSPAPPPSVPVPPSAQILSVTLSGNGCPADSGSSFSFTGNSTSASTSPDGSNSTTIGVPTGLVIMPANLTAQIPGPITSRTKNCQVHMNVQIGAPGWQFAVGEVDLNGYLVLEPGAVATVYATAYWSADASDTFTAQTGLSNSDGLPRTEFKTVSLLTTQWSPCSTENGFSGLLNLNMRVAATSSAKDNGLMSYAYFGPYTIQESNFTYPVTETLSFQWRECTL